MKTKVVSNATTPNCYDLWVNDELEISCESDSLVNAVNMYLQGFGCPPATEAGEIADRILEKHQSV